MDEEKNSTNDFQSLKAKREALGLSLKDVFQRTRVSVVYLEALENNDFHLLPLPVYTKNFIKTYARFLDIDSKQILNDYENYLNSLKILENLPPEDVPEKVSFFTRISHYNAYWGIASVLIVIALVMWLISMQYRPASDIIINESPDGVSSEGKEQVASSPVSAAVSVNERTTANLQSTTGEKNAAAVPFKEKNSSLAENTQAIADSEEASRLVIKATEATWIKIKADQKPIIQVFLKPGEKFEHKAASFDMDIGNAGGVKVQFKGKNIENLGKSGQVIHLRLP